MRIFKAYINYLFFKKIMKICQKSQPFFNFFIKFFPKITLLRVDVSKTLWCSGLHFTLIFYF